MTQLTISTISVTLSFPFQLTEFRPLLFLHKSHCIIPCFLKSDQSQRSNKTHSSPVFACFLFSKYMAVQSGFCSENLLTLSSMAALTSELEIQKQEIDYFLHFQKQKVRSAIRNVEREGWRVIREKEWDLAEAIRRGRDVEERVKKAEEEKERWKRMAKEKGSMVMGLQRKLKEARERQIMDSNGREDAESHYPLQEKEEEEEEEESGDSGSGRGRSALVCKSCKRRNLCVLFLPCRHLCSCKYCEALLGCCPVCHSVKEASVEVLFL